MGLRVRRVGTKVRRGVLRILFDCLARGWFHIKTRGKYYAVAFMLTASAAQADIRIRSVTSFDVDKTTGSFWIVEIGTGIASQGTTYYLGLAGSVDGECVKFSGDQTLVAGSCGGSGSANIAVQENDVNITSPTAVIDFNTTQFDVTENPSDEANVELNSSSVTLLGPSIGTTEIDFDPIEETELDTFSELQSQIADKTLVNEEDAATWDSPQTFSTATIEYVIGSTMTVRRIEWADGTVQVSSPPAGGGSDTNAIREIIFDAGSFIIFSSTGAPLEQISTTSVSALVRSFDDTTREYVEMKWQVPGDIDTSGSVTLRAYVMAKTAAASKNVQLDFEHYCANDSESFEGSYTEVSSGDFSIDATQHDVTEKTWTETVSNLGWAANDMCFGRLSRDPGATDDLTGDMHLFTFTIEVPRQ